jgi:hypothetical protein
MEQETTSRPEPLPGRPGSHAWMLDLLDGLGHDLTAQNALFGWEVSRGDKWATITMKTEGQTHAWRLVPVDREERRKVDGS